MSIVDPRLSWEDTFLAGKYQRTLELLNKVSPDQRTESWKHNVAITEYCAQNCTEEEVLERLTTMEGPDNQAVLLYNKAVILYKMKQFRSSEEILQKIWSDHASTGTRVSAPVGLLLIQLAFLARQESKGLKLCDELEKILSKDSVEETIGEVPSFKTRLQLYRSKLLSLSEDCEASSKDLSSILSKYSAHASDSEPSRIWQLVNVNAATLQAQAECYAKNFSTALDQLSACSDPHQLSPTLFAYYNNLACVHKYAGNAGLAKFYLIRSLTCFEDMGLSTVNEHRVKTLYNLGLCCLHDDRDPESAMLCFEETRPLYYNRPKLWLRMAECCTQRHQQRRLDAQRKTCQSSLIREDCSGTLCGRRVLLPLPNHTTPDKDNDTEDNLSLASCLLYLKNAHTLLKDRDDVNLYYHVLICLAYVCLCKGCPNQTEKYCTELLKHPGQPSAHYKIIAKNYLAEALCMLGRSKEALQHLDLSSEEVDDDQKVCSSFTNLAAVYILEKNSQKAHLCLQAAISCNPIYVPALKLLAYLYLQNGRVEEALKLLSKHRPEPEMKSS